MTQSLGSNAKVRWDKPKDRLNPERTGKQLARLEALVAEVGKLWLEALEHGVYQGRRGDMGRPSTFEETDPTSGAALSMTQQQTRRAAKRAAVQIEQAMERLEDAAAVLHDGFILTDDDVLGRFLEKRNAATQGP